jgi:hypothetical protein
LDRARNRIEEVIEGSTEDDDDKEKCKHKVKEPPPSYEVYF